MSDNQPKDDREELDVAAYCKGLRDLKKNYKLYTNENKYVFAEDGSKLKHDLSVDGEKIVKEIKPKGPKGPKKGKDYTDLYNKLKVELTENIDEKFNDFKQENNQRFDEFQDQLVKMENMIDENKQETKTQINNLEKKFDENKQETKEQINNLEKKFDENKQETKEQINNLENKIDESKLENKKQIEDLEKRLNKKIDDHFDEILKAIKENK
ncbi:hypothetical protein CJJ23_04890 [Mycoplasmopsis agassizii]|uniref:Uncharacterized protein n=1 Tax=Mycoplasmopsis agassizii TaxID=33922 RepID=A0A269THE8_9BACT|nr:hypothetical protein [Mycoplasmopsis agassizii]PAK20882.1 hypothetical protein CJJ23_04890 [Mycoplasmopsis agassizii]